MHGRDIGFYKAHYGATFWALPGMQHEHLIPDKELISGGDMPFAGCGLFEFRTSKRPEGILHIDRAGGILVSGDSLQNWVEPDGYFSEESCKMMTEMGFFCRAGIGPLWMQLNEPKAQDFVRLLKLPFRHLLPAHGSPLCDTAKEDFTQTIGRTFGAAI
jgi:hypothetical protein